MSFPKILISYESFNDFVSFMRSYWHARKYFYSVYFFICPGLNQSLKQSYDYIFLVKKTYSAASKRHERFIR